MSARRRVEDSPRGQLIMASVFFAMFVLGLTVVLTEKNVYRENYNNKHGIKPVLQPLAANLDSAKVETIAPEVTVVSEVTVTPEVTVASEVIVENPETERVEKNSPVRLREKPAIKETRSTLNEEKVLVVVNTRKLPTFETVSEPKPSHFSDKKTDDLAERLARANESLWRGEYNQAIAIFSGIVEENSGNTEAWLGLAKALSWQGELVSAEQVYRQGIATVGEDDRLLAGLGETLNWQGKQFEAIEYYNHAIGKSPANGYYLEGRGWAWLWLGVYDKAKQDVEAALAIQPDNPYAHKLQEKIRNRTDLRVRNDFSYSMDNNDLSLFKEAFYLDGLYSTQTQFSLGARLQRFQQKQQGEIYARGIALNLAHRFNKAYSLTGEVYLDSYSSGKADAFTVNTWVTFTPNDRLRLDAGYERAVFANIQSLEMGIYRDIYKIGIDLKPNALLTTKLHYQHEQISDSNNRNIVYHQTDFLLTRKPLMWLDYHVYYLRDSKQLGNGYFNPESLLNYGLGFRVNMPLGEDDKARFKLYAAMGPERQQPGKTDLSRALEVGFEFYFRENFWADITWNYFDSKISDADSFGVNRVTASVNFRF